VEQVRHKEGGAGLSLFIKVTALGAVKNRGAATSVEQNMIFRFHHSVSWESMNGMTNSGKGWSIDDENDGVRTTMLSRAGGGNARKKGRQAAKTAWRHTDWRQTLNFV
jgi:hypothetical protein